jgi:hypothetical protein
MNSIPPKTLCELANAVAFELGLPWRVEDLRMKALEVYRTVERRAANSGLSREQASELVREHIYEQVMKAGKRRDALPPDKSKPTPEQIEMALEAFTVKQWTPVEQSPSIDGWPTIEKRFGLMESVSQVEVEALLSYIRQHSARLKEWLGATKVDAIEGRAIERHTQLSLPEDRLKLIPVSDVYWTGYWHEQARQANRVGKGHTATGRSIVELSGDSSIARRLTKRDEQTGRDMKVDDREVKRWRERMESLPFEQYAADVEADDPEKRAVAFTDWLTKIRKKYQRPN